MNSEEIVRETAYAIWEAEGRPHGRELEHWRMAEERVRAGMAETRPARSRARSGVSAGSKTTAAPVTKKPSARKPRTTAKPQ